MYILIYEEVVQYEYSSTQILATSEEISKLMDYALVHSEDRISDARWDMHNDIWTIEYPKNDVLDYEGYRIEHTINL